MGLLVDGKWVDQWYDTKASKGHFKRKPSQFRNWITADGRAGPSGVGGFKAEAGRYHLYISHACPWAHRTAIFRHLKGLEGMVGLSVVHPYMGADGWTFSAGEGVVPDPINAAETLHQIYTAANPRYTGRVTVPVVWDKAQATIVSNESAEIIRMFNTAFNGIGATTADYYPKARRAEIDTLNARIYTTVNNGVYMAGFATTQAAYKAAVVPLFESLDWLESILAKQRTLAGGEITEADWRLFTTLIRFDPVYVGHFKCNLKRIADYPALSGYLRDLFQHQGVAATVNMAHIKGHYYGSHPSINPTGIVPLGPETNYSAPHGRQAM